MATEPALAGVATELQPLRDLAAHIASETEFTDVLNSLDVGQGGTLGGVWGSSCAVVAAALAARCRGKLVVVLPHANQADGFCDDLALFSDKPAKPFPAWESQVGERVLHDDIYGERLRLLKQLTPTLQDESDDDLSVVVTSIQSLMQPVASREQLVTASQQLKVGDRLSVDQLTERLVAHGCTSTTSVELPGEFTVRGGILDLFPPDAKYPLRIELFDDEIDSIRSFDVATQRSLARLDRAVLTFLPREQRQSSHFASFLPADSWFLLIEPTELAEEGRYFHRRHEDPELVFGASVALAEAYKFPSVTASGVPTGSYETTAHLRFESVEQFSGNVDRVRSELDSATSGQQVFLVCETEAEAERLREVFDETSLATEGRLHFTLGRLANGFRLVDAGVVLISAAELFHRQELTRPTVRQSGRAIDSFLQLREGDLVVHLSHGIGRYRGIKLLEKEGAEEHLELEYHGGTRIFVPASKIELVQKYVGGRKAKPTLAKIGGKAWIRQKEAARKAVVDLAADMLHLQAQRESRQGIAYGSDSQWQLEFDAAFPYQETPDQLEAIRDIKADMQQPKSMDRLLCGDVGFGKTELAMRAAFKAIDEGYQVAVLAPTTVLAEQHRRTFSQRMAEFPFEIAAISRFCTAKQQREILERTANGSVDVLIGTHRLASPDVHFQNLGLVIIDEEQRFGVAVKERLKALRSTVDVLTMTATPIPRTLHLSLLGVRSISNLETAPRDRLAVETRIARFDESLIRHAVLRELNRDGQIYFVHNRVHDIQSVAHRLNQIVPEATVRIGHGQMPESELEDVMVGFVNKQFDILLATTIVESGLDIPNANTMFIDDADRHGLADLHQLRGRVGRYKHRAYCYLLVDESRHLSPEAARRLRAIEEFSQMGAGFALAMRDLELRGAGNLLGTQQSGHIASVGYELYCALLEKAVRELRGMPQRESIDISIDLPVAAFFPPSYIPDIRTKIDLYRRIAQIKSEAELDDFHNELKDRFGRLPAAVDQLLELARIRVWAFRFQLRSIHLEDKYLVLTYANRTELDKLIARSEQRLRVADAHSAYLPLGDSISDAEAVVTALKSLLRPDAGGS